LKRVLVKFISIYAEKMGKEKVLELEDSATVEDLVNILSSELEKAGIHVKPIVFVNYRFASEKQLLKDGDEVLVMPPFAGG
jgi:molybdopterin converting factor small subunit